MAEQEYFVRKPDSENARGPFNLEKLQSLAEAGQVDRESVYYDAATETWKPIGDSPELCARLFPEKVKLTLKKRTNTPSPEQANEPAPAETRRPAVSISLKKRETPEAAKTTPATPPADLPPRAAPKPPEALPATPRPPAPPTTAPQTPPPGLRTPSPTPAASIPPPAPEAPQEGESARSGMSVDDLLSAAEGQTDEMAELREAKKWRDRAIAMAMPLMALIMLASGAAILFPWRDEIVKALSQDGSWMKLVEQPRIVLGAVDILLALLLGLAVASVYPILRLRLMVGLGYLGYLAFAEWAAGSPTGAFEMIALAIFSVGVFICSLTTRFAVMLISGLAALTAAIALGAIWNMPGILN